MRAVVLLHSVACVAALVVPWISVGSATQASRFPGWPTSIDGLPLRPVAMTQGEEALARDFPGRMAKFTDGRRHIILRFVERDTRLFHSPAECMRNLGYDVRTLPTIVDADGRRWGAFEATRAGQRLLVRERIYESAGDKSWTDVSSWYWAASLRRSTGPWWSILIAEVAAASEARAVHLATFARSPAPAVPGRDLRRARTDRTSPSRGPRL